MKLGRWRMAGFTGGAPLPRMNRASGVLHVSTLQSRRASCRRKSRVAVPVACSEHHESTNVEHGLTITRQEILHRTRRGRTAKLRRRAMLSEIEMPGRHDARVDVWLVITRDRSDFRVRAKVKSNMIRICDRCAREYVAEADGRFDVILRTGDAESEEEEAELVEALEEFGPGVGEIWLGDHVRDGVYLGVPTRSLCSADCRGVEVRVQPESGSVVYKFEDGSSTGENGGQLGNKEAAERLRELKRRLEKGLHE